MPSKDKIAIAPEASARINALAALIGSGIDASYAFKSASTTATTDIAAPTISPNV